MKSLIRSFRISRLLIFDEPTRVLAPHELDAFFKVLNNLRNDGYAIILITHKMNEVLACADRITVLRSGRVSGSLLRSEATEKKLSAFDVRQRINGVNSIRLQLTENLSPY